MTGASLQQSDASELRGILPAQGIEGAIAAGQITAAAPIEAEQVQPASLDLRIGAEAYRVQASFLPGPEASVMERVAALEMHRLDLTAPAVLERGCVYIVPLQESLALPAELSARANPKSSTGRLDVFARLITDRGRAFEDIPAGYQGPLYAEISPRTFSVLLRAGDRLNQLRLISGGPAPGDALLAQVHAQHKLVYAADDRPEDPLISGGLWMSLDLALGEVVGYRAKRHAPIIDLAKRRHYEVLDFWDPIPARPGGLILNPDDFYILASKERIRVPPDYAAEMVAYDTSVGEYRAHYAGFFDPGFGYGEGEILGTRAVLEVRSHEVPFLLEDGQVVGRLLYEPLTERPAQVYGQGIGSSYQRQSLALAKQFKSPGLSAS
ncbi:MAG: 2'-deoxycytidine 5'-triphosphate deaminase [Kiloniellales bacterium]|nr:2'-deoxycytidine 5'-triphosphate deaminase [Kiloniellales bacterium]